MPLNKNLKQSARTSTVEKGMWNISSYQQMWRKQNKLWTQEMRKEIKHAINNHSSNDNFISGYTLKIGMVFSVKSHFLKTRWNGALVKKSENPIKNQSKQASKLNSNSPVLAKKQAINFPVFSKCFPYLVERKKVGKKMPNFFANYFF